ncbi:MAG: aldo/keto reductase [Proteobacteria bacterium]|nr:aldo/keto reductase [Pseudomonadota bacterium]
MCGRPCQRGGRRRQGARKRGVNLFDCANVYSQREAERILGELIAGCRDEMIITTKVAGKIGQDINASGSSRRHIMAAVEESLKRLKTDRIASFSSAPPPATDRTETVKSTSLA